MNTKNLIQGAQRDMRHIFELSELAMREAASEEVATLRKEHGDDLTAAMPEYIVAISAGPVYAARMVAGHAGEVVEAVRATVLLDFDLSAHTPKTTDDVLINIPLLVLKEMENRMIKEIGEAGEILAADAVTGGHARN